MYRSFYRLDNAGLTPAFKNDYFHILQELKEQEEKSYTTETIKNIAKRLDEFQTLRNTKSFQFSFITKMLNTIYIDSPIWDSEVRTVFNFPKIPYMHNKSKTSLDDKLDIAIAQLLYMKDVFQEINESNELRANKFGFLARTDRSRCWHWSGNN